MQMDQPVAAPAAEVTQPAPGATPAAAPQPEQPKPERTFSQAELDEIVEKRLAKERKKRDELRQERDVLRKLALERPERQPEPPKPQPTGEPTRDQFGTYEEFIEARADWRADQKVDKRFKEREDADRQRTERDEQEKKRAQFNKSMRETAKGIEDFDEVIGSADFSTHPVGQMNPDVLTAADEPGRMFHYLVTHPEEAERIASLPMGKQAREIASLEQKQFPAKAPVKPSKAPEPISPVGGKASVGDEMPDPAKNGGKDWLKWRQQQLAEKAKRARA